MGILWVSVIECGVYGRLDMGDAKLINGVVRNFVKCTRVTQPTSYIASLEAYEILSRKNSETEYEEGCKALEKLGRAIQRAATRK